MNCKAVCYIYSGRPDPGWELTNKQAEEAEKIWNSLKTTSTREVFPSILGYRGISITCEDGREFFVFNKKARGEINNKITWKVDEDRKLEKFLISTAPNGIFPTNTIIDAAN
jgi:hypothetical protein